MPNSLTYSSRGGRIVSTTAETMPTPQLSQALISGAQISVLGADADSPENQVIAIQSANTLTLPVPALASSSALQDGQVVAIVNTGAHSITFPLNAFHTGSQPEVLEAKQMIQIIWKPPIGWIPMDDDSFSDQLPIRLWNGSNSIPANGRVLFHEKGLLLKKGTLGAEPMARLETSSFAPGAKVVGANYALTFEEHTVMLGGGDGATFTLPNPTTCPAREYRLLSEMAPITLAVTGGSKVTTGQNTQINTIAAGKGLTVQAMNGVWRKVGEF